MVAWVLGALLLLVVLLPFALYIPWVQNVAKDFACDYVNEKTGLTVSIDRILIKFPLDLSVDGVKVLDEQKDTMLIARNFTAGVAVKPLLDLRFDINEARLSDAFYKLTSQDSSMMLRVDVRHCVLKGSNVDLNKHTVNVLDGELTGGRVDLTYQPWKVVHEVDTTQAEPWRITAGKLRLNDVDYTMTMQPTIDHMKAHLGRATLERGLVGTGSRTVDVGHLAVDTLSCDYTYLSAARAREFNRLHPIPPDTVSPPGDTATWTVRADSLRLTGGNATYAVSGATPKRGLDMDHLGVTNLDLDVHNFYNRGANVSLNLRNLRGKERSGLEITRSSGTIALDGQSVNVEAFKVNTVSSEIYLNGKADLSVADASPSGIVNVSTNSKVALQDVTTLFPEYQPLLKEIPQNHPITLKGDIKGNTRHVALSNVTAEIPRYARARVSGTIDNPTNPKQLRARLDVDAKFDNINFIKPTLLDQEMQRQVQLPPMALNGHVDYDRGNVAGNATMRLDGGGTLVGKGSFNAGDKGFNVDATATRFPVQAILPTLGVRDVTGHVRASGKGFDFMGPHSNLTAQVELQSITYDNTTYHDLNANLDMKNGNMGGRLRTSGKGYDLDMNVDGTITGDRYALDLNGNVMHLDLQALGMTSVPCHGSSTVAGTCDIDLRRKDYNANLALTDFKWHYDGTDFFSDKADVAFTANDRQVDAAFSDEGTTLTLHSGNGFDTFIDRLKKTGDIATKQIKERDLDINELQEALPQLDMALEMGPNGVIPRFLEHYEVDFRHARATLTNDSTLKMKGLVSALSVGTTAIDTLTFDASEWNKYLAFNAHMGNRPGTWDEFAQVDIHGGAKGSTVDFLLEQRNIKKEMGYRLGVNAKLEDNTIHTRFFPQQPIIGYRQWTINDNNFVNLDLNTRQIDADLNLNSGKSRLALVTQPAADDPAKKDIRLNINNLIIEEWTRILPGIKDMKGQLDADMKVAYDGHAIEGGGLLKLTNFSYDNRKVGDMALNTTLAHDPATASTRVNAALDMDGGTVATAMGSYSNSDKDHPLDLHLTLNDFPLRKASAFIPGRMIALRGKLDGELSVNGNMDNPVINGYLQGDSAQVRLPRYGSTLLVSDERIPVNNNMITFNNFAIYGLNAQPVLLNGQVDFRSLNNMRYDLTLRGRNVQFIGEEQKVYSQIFGKGFADLDGRVNGSNNFLDIRADVSLLSNSNITYVMKDEISAGSTSKVDENMVTFVDPTGETGVNLLDSLKTGAANSTFNMLANIAVEQGAKVNVFLSEDGKDRASIEGNGHLKYAIDFAGKDNLTGTYNITGGEVRYSPPVISQKVFAINDGSSITWTGDMLNPQLNINGVQKVKTSVNDGDASTARLVEFDIHAHVGNTLSRLDLSFDLEAPGDMGVQNELQTMSDDQRSQAAINMLLYNSYSGMSKTSNFNITGITAGNALYSFLQSQLNNWASGAIKGVDLSFGISQYESATARSGVQTSYSYRLSKSLFNDRLKIVVGGEYSTDVTSEENFSKNLINDLSVEYLLNASGSRYLRLFHNTGYESILEGKVVKTGVGFVMKHKVSSLGDLFRRRKPQLILPADTTAPAPADTIITTNDHQ